MSVANDTISGPNGLFPNRIVHGIEKVKGLIEERRAKKLFTDAQFEAASKASELDFEEHFKYQEIKTLAVIHEMLSVDEGQSIYMALGNTHTHFNKQPLEVRVVLMMWFTTLLKWKIEGMPKKHPADHRVQPV